MGVVITNAAKAPYNRIKDKGEEAQKAAKHKIDKLQNKCHNHGYHFSPLSFEVQGQWGEDTKRLFKSIIAQTSSHASARAQTSTYWIRKISITLQTFVSYHIRKSLYSVNALLHDAHTSTHTELFTYINATDRLDTSFQSS